MNYDNVDIILERYGLQNYAAFDGVGIAVQPIDCSDPYRCALGLYYPDDNLIVIPPTSDDSVFLHELGHRYGHYYYNDLSEEYAELFSERLQSGLSVPMSPTTPSTKSSLPLAIAGILSGLVALTAITRHRR